MRTNASGMAEQAGDSASLEMLARAGLVAYGVVHLLIGWLAVKIAWSASDGKSADTSGALKTVADQPFGKTLKGVAVGLVGGLLSYATLTLDRQKQGLDGAMQAILAQPFGKFLLTAAALGFGAFGVFAILQSRYRRM